MMHPPGIDSITWATDRKDQCGMVFEKLMMADPAVGMRSLVAVVVDDSPFWGGRMHWRYEGICLLLTFGTWVR